MATIHERLKAAGINPAAVQAAINSTEMRNVLDPPPPRDPDLSETANSYVGRVREVGHNRALRFLVVGAMPKNLAPEHAKSARVELWSSQEEKRWRSKAIPHGVGFVFVMTSWMGHQASDSVVSACRAQDIPYAMGLQSGELRKLLDIGLTAKADVLAPVEETPPPDPNTPPAWHRLAPPKGRAIEGGVLIDAVTRRPVSVAQTVRDLGLDVTKRQIDEVHRILPILSQWFSELEENSVRKAVSDYYLARGIRTRHHRTRDEIAKAQAATTPAPDAAPQAIEAPPTPPPVETPVPGIEDALAAIDGAARALMTASDALQSARSAVLHARATASNDIAKMVEDGLLESASRLVAQIRGQQ